MQGPGLHRCPRLHLPCSPPVGPLCTAPQHTCLPQLVGSPSPPKLEQAMGLLELPTPQQALLGYAHPAIAKGKGKRDLG